MDYYVYTDGAYSKERELGAWSYMIFTDKSFVEWVSNKTKFIISPTYAEDVAVGMASHTLIKRGLTKEDRVIIHSDSNATISLLTSVIENGIEYKNKNLLVQDSIRILQHLSEITNVQFCKVHAHKKSLNPNICVDRMAKFYLRS